MDCSVAERALRHRLGWVAILILTTAAASVAASAALFIGPPDDLRSAPATTELPVNSDRYDDARGVQLSVKEAVPIPVAAPAPGRITSNPCEPGASIESGTSPVSIDGFPRLALATRIPLWRDLALDTKGDDVRALQEELSRLGFPLTIDGTMGGRTMAAAAAAFARIGVTIDQETVPLDAIVWIPSPASRIAECAVPVGADVVRGDTLASFASLAPTVSIDSMPGDLIDGPRLVVVGESRFEVSAEGIVSVPDLSVFPAGSGRGVSGADLKPIDAQLVLSDPLEVSVIVPSAVFDADGTGGCVTSGGVPHRVDILGSQLGATIVVFRRSSAPTHVDTPPRTGAPCT